VRFEPKRASIGGTGHPNGFTTPEFAVMEEIVATCEAVEFHQAGDDLTLVARRPSHAPVHAVAIHPG
jgi:hypothetical protein